MGVEGAINRILELAAATYRIVAIQGLEIYCESNDMVVLKNIPRILSPQLLSVLARMGHGDEIGELIETNYICQNFFRKNIKRGDIYKLCALCPVYSPSRCQLSKRLHLS